MTKTGFGEHLKREREMRGVSLDEICAATRIGTRMLQAMETEDWERLPGGVFNRGFVRAVARYLGLDEEGMVAEYVMAVNQGNPTTAPAGNASAEIHLNRRPTNWLPWIGGIIVLLLLGAGWLGWHFYAARRAQANLVQSSKPAIPAATPLPSGPQAGASSASATPGAPAATTTSAGAPDATGKLLLKIEAGKATNVTVASDGRAVFAGSFIAGQTRVFEAAGQFDVSAEDAGALLLQLNGKTLAPIGPPGHSGKVTLTRRTLESVAGGAN